MGLQTFFILLAATAAAFHLGRSALRGGCRSGCGACGRRTCPAKRLARTLEAAQLRRSRP